MIVAMIAMIVGNMAVTMVDIKKNPRNKRKFQHPQYHTPTRNSDDSSKDGSEDDCGDSEVLSITQIERKLKKVHAT
jgi:hypothetical protein